MWNGVFQLSEATAAQRRVFLHLVDATDGITAEVGEAAGQPQISKNGAAWANTTATLTAIGNGRYYVELTAAELDTVGGVQVRYKSAATAEAIAAGQVVPWDPYDAVRQGMTALPNAAAEAAGGLYTRGAGAGQINQPANGLIDTNVENWNATAVPAEHTAGYPIVTMKDGTGTGEIDTASGRVAITEAQIDQIVDETWDELKSAHTVADSFGDYLDDEITSRSSHSAADVWTAATRTLTAFSFAVDISAAAVTLIWDKLTSALTTVGSIGKLLVDNVNATISSRSSHSAADVRTEMDSNSADLNTIVTAVANLDATISSRATPAQVNAEVLDVLNVDTFGEPTGAPAATTTLRTKIGFLYEALRNKLAVTSTTKAFFDDAGVSQWTKTVSDDGTTYTEAEGS